MFTNKSAKELVDIAEHFIKGLPPEAGVGPGTMVALWMDTATHLKEALDIFTAPVTDDALFTVPLKERLLSPEMMSNRAKRVALAMRDNKLLPASMLDPRLLDTVNAAEAVAHDVIALANEVERLHAQRDAPPQFIPLGARVVRPMDGRKGAVYETALNSDSYGLVQVVTVRADDGPTFDFTVRADRVRMVTE